MRRILIAENDEQLNQILCDQISKVGFRSETCASLKTAFELLNKYNFELIILDRLLDDGDGIEVSRYLADLEVNTRILFISDLGETSERILGLENGGDDYLSKPFSLVEFSLKVGKMMSVTKNIASDLIVGDISLDLKTSSVSLQSQKNIFLRSKEAAILRILIRRQNQIVSREQIISEVWGGVVNIPSYVTIDAYIRKIRMKLSSSPTKIITHRGIGYRISG